MHSLRQQVVRVVRMFWGQTDIGPGPIVEIGHIRLVLCQGTSPDIWRPRLLDDLCQDRKENRLKPVACDQFVDDVGRALARLQRKCIHMLVKPRKDAGLPFLWLEWTRQPQRRANTARLAAETDLTGLEDDGPRPPVTTLSLPLGPQTVQTLACRNPDRRAVEV